MRKILLLLNNLIFILNGFVQGAIKPGVVHLTEAECKKNCDVKKANCYYPDYQDCRFFKNCFLEKGRWKGFLRPCPYGQFWSTQWNSCDYYYNVNCKADKCDVAGITHYTNQHKLTYQKCNRNYWSCRKGRSEPRCCHEGDEYQEGRGCVASNCLGRCLLSINNVCKYEAVGFRFGQNNENCRKHMVCKKIGKSKVAISQCCPQYHRFQYGQCLPDPQCETQCPEHVKHPPPVKPKPVVCPKYKVRPECPVGEIWGRRHGGCEGCVIDPTIKRLSPGVVSFRACRHDILYVDLDFTQPKIPWYNVPNKAPTVTKIWAGGKNLQREQDKLVFGKGRKISYLSFPWYHNNIEARFKFFVEIKFKTDNSGDNLQTLLSDCFSKGGGPSLAILKTSTDPANKITIFAQSKSDSASISLSYVPYQWNVLRVIYDGFNLRATLTAPGSAYAKKSPLRGKLVVATHELRFGTCISGLEKPIDQYHGLLDYIKIWGCKTGWQHF